MPTSEVDKHLPLLYRHWAVWWVHSPPEIVILANKLCSVIPTLDQYHVGKWMYHAIMTEVDEFNIYWFNPYIKMFGEFLPLNVKNYVTRLTTGNGMKTFTGRREMHKKLIDVAKTD